MENHLGIRVRSPGRERLLSNCVAGDDRACNLSQRILTALPQRSRGGELFPPKGSFSKDFNMDENIHLFHPACGYEEYWLSHSEQWNRGVLFGFELFGQIGKDDLENCFFFRQSRAKYRATLIFNFCRKKKPKLFSSFAVVWTGLDAVEQNQKDGLALLPLTTGLPLMLSRQLNGFKFWQL